MRSPGSPRTRRPRHSRGAFMLAGALSLALCCTTIAGAARNDAASARDVARAFVEAGKSGDTDAFAALLTVAAQKELGPAGPAGGGPQGEYRLGDAVVTGDSAYVPVSANDSGTEQTADLRMRLEAGEWRIYGVALRNPDGTPAFFIDFEHPEEMLKTVIGAMGDSLAAAFGGEPARAAAPPLSPAELNAFNGGWQLHGRLAGTASAVLDSMTSRFGIESDWSAAEDAAAHPVAVELEGRSVLQAIDDIARQADVHPVFESGGVTLAPGPRLQPVAFAGPFMLEVTGVSEYAPYAVGTIEVTLSALGLPSDVLNALDGQSDLLSVNGATDASGGALVDSDAPASSGGGVYDTEFRESRTLGLRNLLRGVSSIASLEAGFTGEVPTGTEPSAFEARVVSGTGSLDYRFVLNGVALDHAAEEPATIEPARFDGGTPVTMEVKSVQDDDTFRSLHVALANASNKAVRRVHFNVVYLGADGGVLESFPQDQEGPAGDDADQAAIPILAKPGSGAEFDVTAFFMPDEAKRARIEVLSVGFMDGTAWAAP